MATSIPSSLAKSDRSVVVVCAAAMIALAVAMGIGRFAFTPLFPLMVRDGLLSNEAGALLAASNYLGYLVGAVLATRIKVTSSTLLALGLISTIVVTAAVGWTESLFWWTLLRFIAGVMSAWSLVATSAWGLGWLAHTGRPKLAGIIFAGVGLGIAAAGVFTLVFAGPDVTSSTMWVKLAILAGIAILIPLTVSRYLPAPGTGPSTPQAARTPIAHPAHSGHAGLIISYSLFGFGYILPATYLPALAQQLVDDPRVFGWAWPVFGIAAALSTPVVAWGLKKANRLNVWASCHAIMAIGVLLPCIRASLPSIVIAALLVGATFMVVTMVGMQEASARVQGDATAIFGKMTAGFALGQLLGPVASAVIGHLTTDYTTALNYALMLSGAGLLFSAFYLWRQACTTTQRVQNP